jgi:hypothetical protein
LRLESLTVDSLPSLIQRHSVALDIAELNIRKKELHVKGKRLQDMGCLLNPSGEKSDKKLPQWNKGNQ